MFGIRAVPLASLFKKCWQSLCERHNWGTWKSLIFSTITDTEFLGTRKTKPRWLELLSFPFNFYNFNHCKRLKKLIVLIFISDGCRKIWENP